MTAMTRDGRLNPHIDADFYMTVRVVPLFVSLVPSSTWVCLVLSGEYFILLFVIFARCVTTIVVLMFSQIGEFLKLRCPR